MNKRLGGIMRTVSLILALSVCVLSLAACVGKKGETDETGQTTTTSAQTQTAAQTETTKPATQETIYVEWWRTNQEGITWEKDGAVSKWLIEKTGVGMYSPLVIWEGGTGYETKLNTRIATGDLPDIFMPRKGIEVSLAKDGLIWELSEYLPKYCPSLWNSIPQEIWSVVRAADPTGKGGIYYIPMVYLYNSYSTFIRKDWLDELKLDIPENQDEYVDVLKAFKKKDSNIIPTIGREYGRWMDHLFYMYDVAMFEGYPAFDLYNGEMTYSAVTENMRKALEFIHRLYKEELLDQETFMNKASNLWEKVRSDRVGSWFHLSHGLDGMVLVDLLKVNPKADVVVLPPIAAEGYTGKATIQQIWGPYWAFGKKKDGEKHLIASLQLLDWLADPKNLEEVSLGVPELHWTVKDGKKVRIDYDVNKVEKKVIAGCIERLEDKIFETEMAIAQTEDANIINSYKQKIRAMQVSAQPSQFRRLAQDGMPSSVYEGYPDISSHKIYQEYMTKIIVGELPVEAFDEFVKKWNAAGGEEVTKRVRDWYKNVSGK